MYSQSIIIRKYIILEIWDFCIKYSVLSVDDRLMEKSSQQTESVESDFFRPGTSD